MAAAAAALREKESIVPLITFAQALTVLGIPAIAAALVYLGTRPDLRERGHLPGWLIGLTTIGLIVSCGLATLTVNKVWSTLAPATEVSQASDLQQEEPLAPRR
jgi:Mn2+/Fe2+ NRAMP family transporter